MQVRQAGVTHALNLLREEVCFPRFLALMGVTDIGQLAPEHLVASPIK